jgi:Entner-Doudoroff aldolase
MTVQQFLETLRSERCTAIIRTKQQESAAMAMKAAIRGGFRTIEFTMTTPGALELIADFARLDGITVGAGTVLTPEDARNAVKAGARYLVSPVMDEEVIAEGLKLGVTMMPGCHTPTEMLKAHRAGAQLQKVFPAVAGGPDGIRAILGPMPFLRLVPTNGVDGNNAGTYLRAGAFSVAFVASLFVPKDLLEGRYDRIEERAKSFRATVQAVEIPR